MADSWRFDPNKDYSAEDDYSERSNFQRFKKHKKNKKKNYDDDLDYRDSKKKNKWR